MSRTPRLAVVQDVQRLTPRMIRIVFGGEGLTGFGAGEFSDHYVKLQFPVGERTRVAPTRCASGTASG